MLDETKIKLMTRLSIFEEKEEENYAPVMNTNRKDYVGEKVLLEFFLSTFLYAIFAILIIALLFLTVLNSVSRGVFILLIILTIIGYVIFLFYRMSRRRRLATKDYNIRNRKYKKLKAMYTELSDYYKYDRKDR